jgi:signal transduction histidine kinase
MERWRIFGLTTLFSVIFLVGLFLVAEAGRAHLRDASEEMQAAMARRILVGELREKVAEAALAYHSFLITGRAEYLEPLRSADRSVNGTAESLVLAYEDEPPGIRETARQLGYLAGVQTGSMMAAIRLYNTQGRDAALGFARTQDPATDALQGFLNTADEFRRYEVARMREAGAKWQREVSRARLLALAATLANILLVVSATLMALATLRRYREGRAQLARRKEELEVEAAARAAELNEVYGHLQTIQEQERSRLARGLHDELGGLLLAARMDVTWLKQHSRDAQADALQARLQRVLDALDQGIDLKRRVIEELRPTLLDNMGLLAAIRWQAGETCERAGLECACHFPDAEPTVAPRTAIALFRVVQEALTNVQKHAGARHVDVSLDVTGDHLLLSIVDDGRGIQPAERSKAQSHGLAGMQHRISAVGGTLTVEPSPEGGTELRAIVPSSRPGLAARAPEPPAGTVDTPLARVASRG